VERSPFEVQTELTNSAIRRNIEAIRKLEENFQRERTLVERAADAIGSFSGSPLFVGLHAVFFTGYILINLGVVPGLRRFDNYPFLLLSLIVSLEAIFLSTFVLMKQNRMSKQAELRAHLDLQINLLTEREMTLVLQVLERLSNRLGVSLSREVEELSGDTSVEALATELKQNLPEN
jgi:uncharacterized membrane protein